MTRNRTGPGRGALLAALLALLLVSCATDDGVDREGPEPPTDVTATAVAGGIEITWTDESDDETSFNVYRYHVGADGQPRDRVATTPADTESYLDTAVESGRPYGYLVSSENDEGESIPVASNAPVFLEVQDGPPDDGNGGDDPGGGNGDGNGGDGNGGDGDGGGDGPPGDGPPDDGPPGDGDPGDGDPGDGSGDDDPGGGDGDPGNGGGDDPGSDGGDDDPGSDEALMVTSSAASPSETECTLIQAIEAANADEARGGCPAGSGADTIVLQEGEVYEFSEAYGDFDGPTALPSITSEITIEGNGATIQGFEQESNDDPFFRILHVSSAGDLTLKDATVARGFNPVFVLDDEDFPYGAGLHVATGGKATLIRTDWTDHEPDVIYVGAEADLAMSDTMITNNWGQIDVTPPTYGLMNLGTAELTRVTFHDNRLTAVYNAAGATLRTIDSTLTLNHGESAGTGAMINHGSAHLTDTDLLDNSNYDHVAGIVNSGDLLFEGGEMSRNASAIKGGALWNLGEATLRDAVLEDNEGDGGGGAIYNRHHLILENVAITSNTAYAGPGGGILSEEWDGEDDARVEFRGAVMVTGNKSLSERGVGGGIAIEDGTIGTGGTLEISGNHAHSHGGGVYVGAAAQVVLDANTEITGNVAAEGHPDASGGGVFVATGGEFQQNGAVIEENQPNDVATEEGP